MAIETGFPHIPNIQRSLLVKEWGGGTYSRGALAWFFGLTDGHLFGGGQLLVHGHLFEETWLCNDSYLISVSCQFTDKLHMLLSYAVHSTQQIVLINNFVICSICCSSPFLSHTFKVRAHLQVANQCYLDVTKQRHHWKLLQTNKEN